MNLFLNAVSTSGVLILFDDARHIIASQDFSLAGNESSKLVPQIDHFLSSHNFSYTDIQNIVVVHGPGSFTGVRTICLLVNTIAFSTDCSLTKISYFDLFDHYPIVKKSSKRDVFFQESADGEVQVIPNDTLRKHLHTQGISQIYGEALPDWEGQVLEKIDYSDIITHVSLDYLKQIQPLYIKKPNIC